jgi:hypothetical protein
MAWVIKTKCMLEKWDQKLVNRQLGQTNRAGQLRGWSLSPAGVKNFHFSMLFRPALGVHPTSYPMGTGGSFLRGKSSRGVKLTTHLQLVPRSRKCGSIHPLPHTPSWCSAYLVKYRDDFTFYIFFTIRHKLTST